jgi:predicted DNA-binding transcriptional regulator AlpA
MTTSFAFTPLTKQAVADSLGISIRSVENWINDGILPAPAKLGNRVYWHPDVYFGWLSQRLKADSSAEPQSAPAQVPEPIRRAPASADKTVVSLRASTERKLARLQGLN